MKRKKKHKDSTMTTKNGTIAAHGHERHPKPLDTIVPRVLTREPSRNTEELQYLSLVMEILERGEYRPDRYLETH